MATRLLTVSGSRWRFDEGMEERFTGGTILGVAVKVGKDQYLNLEKRAAAALSVE